MASWCKLLAASLVMTVLWGCSSGKVMFKPADSTSAQAKSSEPERTNSDMLAESDLVVQLQQVRADYKRVLQVMHRWYLDHGLHEKATWAAKELDDLKSVRTHQYAKEKSKAIELESVDDSRKASLQNIDLANLSEPDRIEQLQQIRANYKIILQNLIQCFDSSGQSRKADWARQELTDLNRVRKYPYLVEVDIQDTNLSPRDSIIEADRMYEEGLKLMKNSKFLPFINNNRGLKDALDKFTLLIKCYPTSDKIDDAAFYAGEISKEYFNDDIQAIRYYEMSMKWDPKTPHPVRFECAVIYDFRLHDRARAMAMYQRVLKEEADIDQTNTNFSAVRLTQLLKEKEGFNNPPADQTEPAPTQAR